MDSLNIFVAFHKSVRTDLVLYPIVSSPDVLIANEWAEWGVLKFDIVLGFVPPNAREYVGL